MSLIEIKKQIAGVKNTRQITKAMQLVAASKSVQFQKKAVAVRNFAFELLNILENDISDFQKSEYLTPRESGKVLFVLYSSDKGLCGSLNPQMFRTLFQSKAWKDTPEEERLVITFGKKAKTFMEFNKIPLQDSYFNVRENMDHIEVFSYVENILKYWKDGTVKEIYMVAPHYKSSLVFYPLVKKFLPLSPEILDLHLGVHPDSFGKKRVVIEESYMIYEPNVLVVADQLLLNLVETMFIQALYELRASEYSSRMIAMKSATDNANNIISAKTLEFNKVRQAVITQQIAEIAGASF